MSADTQGRCSDQCSQDNFYSCDSQGACEAIGFQWHDSPTYTITYHDPGTPAPTNTCTRSGSCTQPCSIVNPGSCDSQDECTAIGLAWIQRGSAGFPECPDCNEGGGGGYDGGGIHIGGRRSLFEGHGGGINPGMPGMAGYCTAPCTRQNPSSCKGQQTCESAGNQWIIQHVQINNGMGPYLPGGGGIETPGGQPVIVDPVRGPGLQFGTPAAVATR